MMAICINVVTTVTFKPPTFTTASIIIENIQLAE